MDRQLKKVVKNDEFKEQVWHSVDFLKAHPAEIKKYGLIALAVLVVVGGTYFYIGHQASAREEALAQALKIDEASVGPKQADANLHFDTQDEKDQATAKAFRDIVSKYHGSQEAAIAGMNLGQAAVDKGDLAGGEKEYKDVVDSAPAAYASEAKLTLAQLYSLEGKTADAEKLLNELMKNPTLTVSKDEAQIALARVEAKTNPSGACKSLAGLRTERTEISKAAMSAIGELCASEPAAR